MPITQLGSNSKTIFLKGPESHKLHHQFEVATGQSVKKGQPVILNTDGTVQVAAANQVAKNVIGVTIHDGGAGDLVTVAMKAYTIVWGTSAAALNAGPVKYVGVNGTDGDYMNYAAADAAADAYSDVVGWALDQSAAADELVRIALAN